MTDLELLFNIDIVGSEKLATLVTSTRGVGAVAKESAGGIVALDNAIKTLQDVSGGSAASLTNLEAGISSVAQSSLRMNVTLQTISDSLEKLTAKAVRTTTAVEGLGAAHRHAVTDVQAASAAIRGLEGSLSIRAVEQFTTKFLGLGAIFQVAFPLVGAIAFFEVIAKGGEKIYELVRSWDPVVQAQKRATDSVEEYNKSIDKSIKKLTELSDKEFERAHGKAALDRLQADRFDFGARYGQREIDQTRGEIQRLQGILKTGTVPAHFETTHTQGFGATLFSPAIPSETKDKFVDTVQSKEAQAAAIDIKTLQAKLESLQLEQRTNSKESENKDSDAAKRGADEAKRQADAIASTLKRVDDALKQQQYSLLSPIARIQAQGDNHLQDTLAELGKHGANESQKSEATAKIQEAISIQVDSELDKLLGAFGPNGERIRAKSTLPDITDESLQEKRNLGVASRQFSRGLTSSVSEDQKAITTGKQTFDLYIREEQKQAEAQANRTLRLAQLQNGPGGEGRAVEQSYQTRLELAEKLFDITARKINIEVAAADQEKALAEARVKREDEIFQARQEHEQAIAQLQRKALDEARTQAGKLFDAVTSRNPSQALQQFGIGELKGLGRTAFQNIAGPKIEGITSSIASIFPASGPIGDALKGSILDPTKNGDQQKRTADNTADIAKWTKATVDLLAGKTTTDGASFLSGGAAGAGADGAPSIPFLSPSLSPGTANALFGPVLGASLSGDSASASGGLLASLSGSLKQFGGGASIFARQGAPAVWDAITGDSGGTGAERAGVIAGAAGAAIAGYEGVASGVKQGGVGGYSKAVASGAATAAAFDPEPISKAILETVAIVGGVVSAIAGNNPQKRDAAITKYLAQNQFQAPKQQTASFDLTGHYTDFDKTGQVRSSNLSPYSTAQEPYTQRWQGGFFGVPGQTTSPGGSPFPASSPTVINLTIHALDGSDVISQGPAIAQSLHVALKGGQADQLATTIKNRLLPGGF